MKLPVYRAVVGQGGLNYVSLVAEPAIQEKGLAFSSQKELMFKTDEHKGIIIGPAMIPDIPLYRKDKDIGEYVIVFTRESIEYLQEEFMAKNKEYKVNFDHDGVVENAFVKESWIIEDQNNDKSKMYGFDFPVGTLMMMVKVKNKEFFKNEIVKQGRTGFSVEGLFALELTDETVDKKQLKMSMENSEILAKLAELEAKLAKYEEEEKEEEKEKEVAEVDEITEKEKEVVAEEEEVVEETEKGTEEIVEKVLEQITPKLEEVYNMIAEIRNELAKSIEVEDSTEELESKFEKQMSVMRFITANSALNFN